jgi:hypothetical protein
VRKGNLVDSERRKPGDVLHPSVARVVFEAPEPVGCWFFEGGIGVAVTTFTVVHPLEDPDFLTSFARLGARGDPTKAKIERWVMKYGLPKKPQREKDEEVSAVTVEGIDDFMPMQQFVSQVRQIRELTCLYAEISRREIDKIQTRTVQRNSWLDDELLKAFRSLNYRSLRYAVEDGTLSQEELVIMLSVPVLMENVDYHLSEMRWKPVWFLDSVGESYRCPDLLSALYFQLFLIVRDKKRMDYCARHNCRTPFVVTSRKRRFCCNTCRSVARSEASGSG